MAFDEAAPLLVHAPTPEAPMPPEIEPTISAASTGSAISSGTPLAESSAPPAPAATAEAESDAPASTARKKANGGGRGSRSNSNARDQAAPPYYTPYAPSPLGYGTTHAGGYGTPALFTAGTYGYAYQLAPGTASPSSTGARPTSAALPGRPGAAGAPQPSLDLLFRLYDQTRFTLVLLSAAHCILWFPFGLAFLDCSGEAGRGMRTAIKAWVFLFAGLVAVVVLSLFVNVWCAVVCLPIIISVRARSWISIAQGLAGLTNASRAICRQFSMQVATISKGVELDGMERTLRLLDDSGFRHRYMNLA